MRHASHAAVAPITHAAPQGPGLKKSILLWGLQSVLALLFVFAGGMKLLTPAATLASQSPLPPLFVKFIGLAELAGGLGLVLPGLLRIRRGLTAWAALGLTVIMVGATAITAATGAGKGGALWALFPAMVGVSTAFIAYKRWLWRQPRQAGAIMAA